MEITVLGCGNSLGVPVLSCDCLVCRSKNPKNRRTRASIVIHTHKKNILIDTTTDLRQQLFREKISRLDALLYTHPHADHISGIDELRAFFYFQGRKPIPTYANDWTYRDLQNRFSYLLPILEVHRIEPVGQGDQPFEVSGIPVQPLPVFHRKETNTGYRIKNVAYLTDVSEIPEKTLKHMQNLDVLFLDCIQLDPHHSHFHLDKALETAELLRPRQTVLTHLSHSIDYAQISKRLPKGVRLAYDGMRIKVK